MGQTNFLPTTFFQDSAIAVAQNLLGKELVRKYPNGEITSLIINEVEAYDGKADLANHAAKTRTPRNEIMFALGGYFYIYLCYGVHLMLNVVCDRPEYPAAVLIRGAGKIDGPGKLTKFLQIEKSLNGKTPTPENHLWFQETGIKIARSQIITTPRIGISQHAEAWREKPLRFLWKRDNNENSS